MCILTQQGERVSIFSLAPYPQNCIFKHGNHFKPKWTIDEGERLGQGKWKWFISFCHSLKDECSLFSIGCEAKRPRPSVGACGLPETCTNLNNWVNDYRRWKYKQFNEVNISVWKQMHAKKKKKHIHSISVFPAQLQSLIRPVQTSIRQTSQKKWFEAVNTQWWAMQRQTVPLLQETILEAWGWFILRHGKSCWAEF